MTEFEGVSDRGSLDEALNNAIDKALASRPVADLLVSFTVKRIGGQRGGFVGVNRRVVVIDADLHPGPA